LNCSEHPEFSQGAFFLRRLGCLLLQSVT
jgi:hypothetical protein